VTGARVCVTNTLPDVRSCTIAGEHLASCDGRGRRYDPTTHLSVPTTSACTGCVPRPAKAGYLCESCLSKLTAAIAEVHQLVAFMWEDASNGIRDTNSGGGTGGAVASWPLTEARVYVAWIIAAMRNASAVLDGRTDLDLTYLDGPRRADPTVVDGTIPGLRHVLDVGRDDLIATEYGAEVAVRMTRVIQAAYVKFPLEERERHIAGIRCPSCSRSELMWSPPLYFRGDVLIRCSACGHTEPQSYLEQYAAVLQSRGVA
jgi:Zn ribbon nucleic-acid-binding protein